MPTARKNFIKNNITFDIVINIKKVDKLPTNAPKNILFKLVFLFNMYATETKSKKSNVKLNMNKIS